MTKNPRVNGHRRTEILKFSVCVLLAWNSFVLSAPQPYNKNVLDSLEKLIEKEAKAYPIDPDELIIDAPGLKSLADDAYPQLQELKNNASIIRLRYPLVLNEKLLSDRISINEKAILKKSNSEKQGDNDTLASDERYLRIRMFDGKQIIAICDTTYKTINADIWRGHIWGEKGSSVYLTRMQSDGGKNRTLMLKIESLAKPPQYISSIKGSNLLLFTEQKYLPMPENECGLYEK